MTTHAIVHALGNHVSTYLLYTIPKVPSCIMMPDPHQSHRVSLTPSTPPLPCSVKCPPLLCLFISAARLPPEQKRLSSTSIICHARARQTCSSLPSTRKHFLRYGEWCVAGNGSLSLPAY